MYLLSYFERVVLVPTDIRLEWLQKRTRVAAGLLFTSLVNTRHVETQNAPLQLASYMARIRHVFSRFNNDLFHFLLHFRTVGSKHS